MTRGEKDRHRERERRMIAKLRRDHGYMFSEMPRKIERLTSHFTHDRKTRKTTLVAARRICVSFPMDSWLAAAIQADAPPAAKKTSKRKVSR